MKKLHLGKLVYLLFLSIPFVISCTGQDTARFQKDKSIGSKKIGTKYDKVVKSQPTKNGPAENVHCELQDKAGNLWFGTTGHGVFKFDGKSFTNFTEKDGLGSNWVMTICEDKEGNILIGTDKGISLYDGKSVSAFAKHEDLATSGISQLYADKKGQVWIATGNRGVYINDGKNITNLLSNEDVKNDFGLTLTSVSGMIEDKDGLINNSVFSIVEDKVGNLWFGTRNVGLSRFDGKSFVNFSE